MGGLFEDVVLYPVWPRPVGRGGGSGHGGRKEEGGPTDAKRQACAVVRSKGIAHRGTLGRTDTDSNIPVRARDRVYRFPLFITDYELGTLYS